MLSPLHAAASTPASTQQKTVNKASKRQKPIDVSLRDFYKNLRQMPDEITDRFRKTLIQDLFENQHPLTREQENLQQQHILLLTRHTYDPAEYVREDVTQSNNRLLLESLHKNHMPLFDAVLKTTRKMDLPPLMEKALLIGNDDAFTKMLSKVDTPLPQSTLQWAADCGQPEKLEALLEHRHTDCPTQDVERLRLIAQRQQASIADYATLPTAQRNDMLYKLASGGDAPPPIRGRLGQWVSILGSADPQSARWLRNRVNGWLGIPEQTRFQQMVALLKTPDINVNSVNEPYRQTLLHRIFARNVINIPMLSVLTQMPKIMLNESDIMGLSPLHYAVRSGNPDAVQRLTQAPGINPNVRTHQSETPLHWAVCPNNAIAAAAVIRLLLEVPGINVNARNIEDTTPLHNAAYRGTAEMIEALLEMPDIDVNATDRDGRTPLHQVLEAANGDETPEAIENRLNKLKVLLKAPGINVNAKDKKERTPLHEAASKRNNAAAVRLLLQMPGIEVNARNIKNKTPLHEAADQGTAEMIADLLKVPGIDPNAVDVEDHTPLHEVLRLNPDETPNMLENRLNKLRVLLKAPGIDPNIQNKDGHTPLHWAAQGNNAAAVRLLLQVPGIKVNVKNAQDSTPLHEAARHGTAEVIAPLVKVSGIDPNIVDVEGHTPLHEVVRSANQNETADPIENQFNIIEILSKLKVLLNAPGINVNARDKNGQTPLAIASEENQSSMFTCLLKEHGATS